MRYDPIYDIWVAVSEKRRVRPMDFHSEKEPAPHLKYNCRCPFCEGNELETPAELDAVSREIPLETSELEPRNLEKTLDDYRRPNAPGWIVRSVPNRYPFVEPDKERTFQKFGPYIAAPNIGQQEVLVDAPFHDTSLSELNPEEFQYLIHFYHRRLHQLRKEGRWAYAQLFKNQGQAAGASLTHIHSQLVALPFVPPSILQEQHFLELHRRETGKCYHCEILEYEMREKWRFVAQTKYFDVFCPFASRYCGEIHIVPQRHVPCFVQSSREELDDLASLLRKTIQRLEKILPVADYNLVFRTSPWFYTAQGVQTDPNFHWRLEICPRITAQAGFEMGTGCFVNPVAPETVAAVMGSEKDEKEVLKTQY